MSRCCIDCASLFKISKETGKIIWAKDLPFNVTAVYKYGNRIYAAISNISKDRLLFAYYDIIVLNLDGDIIVEECINIFPKTTKDKYVKVEENGITREKLELGIKVDGPFTPLTELFVFKDEEGILYVIGIAGYMIYQIVNSKVRKIQKITSHDKILEGNSLNFICNNSVLGDYTFRNPNSPNIDIYNLSSCGIKIEIENNSIIYSSYDIMGYNLEIPLPKKPDIYVFDFKDVKYKLYEVYLVDISRTRDENLYEYEIDTSRKGYVKFTFDEKVFDFIFMEQAGTFLTEDYKSFDIHGHNTSYYYKSTKELSDIRYESATPKTPSFFISKLNLISFDYTFQELTSLDNVEKMERGLDAKKYIEKDEHEVPLRIDDKYGAVGIVGTSGEFEWDFNRGMEMFENVELRNKGKLPQSFFINSEYRGGYTMKKKKIKVDNTLACKYKKKPTSVIASEEYSEDSDSIVITRTKRGDYRNLIELDIDISKFVNKNVDPSLYAKLHNVTILKNSKTYKDNTKYVFNATLVLTYGTYSEVYLYGGLPAEGDSIKYYFYEGGWVYQPPSREVLGPLYPEQPPPRQYQGLEKMDKDFKWPYSPWGPEIYRFSKEFLRTGESGFKAALKLLKFEENENLVYQYLNGVKGPLIGQWNRDKSILWEWYQQPSPPLLDPGLEYYNRSWRVFFPSSYPESKYIYSEFKNASSVKCELYGDKIAPLGSISVYQDVLISFNMDSGKYDITYSGDSYGYNLNDLNGNLFDGYPTASTSFYAFDTTYETIEQEWNLIYKKYYNPAIRQNYPYGIYLIYGEYPELFLIDSPEDVKINPPIPNYIDLNTKHCNHYRTIYYNNKIYQSEYYIYNKKYFKNLIDTINYNDKTILGLPINSVSSEWSIKMYQSDVGARYNLILSDYNRDEVYLTYMTYDGYQTIPQVANVIMNGNQEIPIKGIFYNYDQETEDKYPSYEYIYKDILNGTKDSTLEKLTPLLTYINTKYSIVENFINNIVNEINSIYDATSLYNQIEFENFVSGNILGFAISMLRQGYSIDDILSEKMDDFMKIFRDKGLDIYYREIEIKIQLSISKIIDRGQGNEWVDYKNDEFILNIDVDKTTASDILKIINKNRDYEFTVISEGPLVDRPIIFALPKDVSDVVVIPGNEEEGTSSRVNFNNSKRYAMNISINFNTVLYEKNRKNIICLKYNESLDKYEVKWTNSFLIHPRVPTDYTKGNYFNDNDNGEGIKLLEEFGTWFGKEDYYNLNYINQLDNPYDNKPLDMNQDDDFIYLGIKERKTIRMTDINDKEDYIQEGKFISKDCSNRSNSYYKTISE